MAVSKTIKNIATAAALVALREKYNRPQKQNKKVEEKNEELEKLLLQINEAKNSLVVGIDRFIARAGKGGVSNSELIKTTAKLKELAKTMG